MSPSYSQLTADGLGEGIKKQIFHLQVLGVHPSYHRMGVGKALVNYMLVQVRVDPTMMTLYPSLTYADRLPGDSILRGNS
jgi:ribosomal protein S18 acetylase RimI-like enzyme